MVSVLYMWRGWGLQRMLLERSQRGSHQRGGSNSRLSYKSEQFQCINDEGSIGLHCWVNSLSLQINNNDRIQLNRVLIQISQLHFCWRAESNKPWKCCSDVNLGFCLSNEREQINAILHKNIYILYQV